MMDNDVSRVSRWLMTHCFAETIFSSIKQDDQIAYDFEIIAHVVMMME
jgi:hypothetical protein